MESNYRKYRRITYNSHEIIRKMIKVLSRGQRNANALHNDKSITNALNNGFTEKPNN